MGHKVRIQKVERGKTKSFYVNFPAAVAEAAEIIKGEELEWIIEDKNTFVLRRVIQSQSVRNQQNPIIKEP
jgi:bifunctional DNA-binding transcriptional regulator/antitoxin component of YhaV-PrlF toxin-antitoxin module